MNAMFQCLACLNAMYQLFYMFYIVVPGLGKTDLATLMRQQNFVSFVGTEAVFEKPVRPSCVFNVFTLYNKVYWCSNRVACWLIKLSHSRAA